MSSGTDQWKKRVEERVDKLIREERMDEKIVRLVSYVEKLPMVFVTTSKPKVLKPTEAGKPPETVAIRFVEKSPEPIEVDFDLSPQGYGSVDPDSFADGIVRRLRYEEESAIVKSLMDDAGHTVDRSESIITQADIMNAWTKLVDSGCGPDTVLLNPRDNRSIAGIIRSMGFDVHWTQAMPKGTALFYDKDEIQLKRTRVTIDLKSNSLVTAREYRACVPTDKLAVALVKGAAEEAGTF